MFFYENLLFLGALGFFSWLILCFINFIKEHQPRSDRYDFSIENTLADMFVCEASTFRRYQAYIICSTICCVVYVAYELIKNPEILNIQRKRSAFRTFPHSKENPKKESKTQEEPQFKQGNFTGLVLDFDTLDSTCTIEEYRRMTKCLRDEIDKVCNRNNELIERIVDLEHENLIIMGKGLLLAREMSETYLNRTNNDSDIVESLDKENTNDNNNTNITVDLTKILSSLTSNENRDGSGDGKLNDVPEFHHIDAKGISMFPFLQSFYFINRYIHIHDGSDNMKNNNTNGEFNDVWCKYIRIDDMKERISKMFESNIADDSLDEDSNRMNNIDYSDYSESCSFNTLDTSESNNEENLDKSNGGLSTKIR